MAEQVFTNPHLTINGVDLSDHVRELRFRYSAELRDITAGGAVNRVMLAGLTDWEVTAEFNQDFATGEVDATLFSLVGAAAFSIAFRPDAGAIAATNPEYQATAVLADYQPLGGRIGDEHVTTCTLRPGANTAPVRDTTP